MTLKNPVLDGFCLIKSGYFFNSLFLAISLWFFAVISFAVTAKDEITYYDSIIVNFLNNIASEHTDKFAIFITKFGFEYAVFLLFAVVLGLLFLKHFKEALLFLLISGGSTILNEVVKNIFDRTRPVIGSPVIQAEDYSFPSGHAMTSVCFFGLIIYFSFLYIKNIWLKTFVISFLSVLILLICLSRVYLGVHYPSDVFGGLFLGLFWLSLCILVYKRFKLL